MNIQIKGTNRNKSCFIILIFVFCLLIPGHLLGNDVAEVCKGWMARVESVQGSILVRRSGEKDWVLVKLNDTFFTGDMIMTQSRSRANIMLCNGTIIRLDQDSKIIFSDLQDNRTFLFKILNGAIYFFSHISRNLKILTPFVNASIRGTEFFIKVVPDKTIISVFEGHLLASNKEGSIDVISGQSAIAEKEKAPASHVILQPRDAVHWALYYPPVIDWSESDFWGGVGTDWKQMVGESIGFYWRGDLAGAFSAIKEVPEDITDPRFFIYRASLLLSVGRVEEATADIDTAGKIDSSNASVYSLRSVIALIQNEKELSFELAKKALEIDKESVAGRISMSYIQQANFDLKGALKSLQDALRFDPQNAIIRSRLAELWLSLGELDKALSESEEAVNLRPYLARTQTVLGFAYLIQIKIREAINAFERAIQLDQAAPLPRLGLGLAKIREGALEAGRREIEIAASLDPFNSLIRSYLGKAYFEERFNEQAMKQFVFAKELDPQDPTPWFYDAIRKQAANRQVEALKDIQKSIELNDNRAVYRSRLLLDDDLAARFASIARIYNELGFQQLALTEGWKAVNNSPGNYSAHRFLADLYSALPRHEIARVSELLQSQLLQPINFTPVQPQLAESNLYILNGAGPTELSFNEFNPLFLRNRIALQGSGIAGGNNTEGDEFVFSVTDGACSYSIGQFHYKTSGFRTNNDLRKDLYNLFTQISLSHKTSIQAEFRIDETEKGDLFLRFEPQNFYPALRKKENRKNLRLGLRHSFAPNSDIIVSMIQKNQDADSVIGPGFGIKTKEDGYLTELQHIFSSDRFHIVSGIGYLDDQLEEIMTFPPPLRSKIRHTNLYIYPQINYPKYFTWTIGLSADFFRGRIATCEEYNPKFGLLFNLTSKTTLRMALFKTLKKMTLSDQTLEPTQVMGFNQFFYEVDASESWCQGIGIDHKFSDAFFIGAEFSRRDIEFPFTKINSGLMVLSHANWKEEFVRAYTYWTPFKWAAVSFEIQFESMERGLDYVGEELYSEVKTYRVPLGISLFHPSGFSVKLKSTYYDQEGEFIEPYFGNQPRKGDNFWIVDLSTMYRLPKQRGTVSLSVKNLFVEEFRFQDTDPKNPQIYPDRIIFGKFTFAF